MNRAQVFAQRLSRLTIQRCLGLLTLASMLAACGGGSGGTPSSPPPPPPPPPPTVTAPSGLSYGTAPAFVVNQAITPLTPTVTGTVSSYSINPALSAGLSLDATSGTLSGTPTTAAATTVYTVTAANSAGSTTTTLNILVNAGQPAGVYPSSAYSFTVGVAPSAIVPSVSTGSGANWSVQPFLPAGLVLSATDGAISGTPTVAAAPATYAISTQPSGNSVAENLKIAVSAGPVLDFGIGGPVSAVLMDATRVLAQDDGGRWVLWDYASGNRVALGSQPCSGTNCNQLYPIDFEAPIFAIGTPTGLEVRSSATGALLSTIATTATWWKLASDGSYVCGGDKTGLTVWSPGGTVVANKSGDYSTASVAATPDAILVAGGPAGANVIESISPSTGSSTLSASFAGVFAAWFTDNSAFLAADSSTNALRVYSPAGVKLDERALPAYTALGGVGQWFWTANGTLSVYQVGNSLSATSTFSLSAQSKLTASGQTIAAWVYGSGPFNIIDLSGATPTNTTVPTASQAYISAYAAVSASQWVVGGYPGAVLDGPSAASTPRYFGDGAPISVAGGTLHYAVATGSGTILYFNSATNALEGQIAFNASNIQMSADGTILAAQATELNAQFSSDRTVNIYSLPSGAMLNSFPSNYNSPPYIHQFTLSASGTLLGEVYSGGTLQVVPVSGGAPQWTSPSNYFGSLLLSPDGSGVAATTNTLGNLGFGEGASTDLYVNGAFVANLPGIAAGWIDNGHLLVNTYNFDREPYYTSSQVYGSKGIVTGAGPTPYVPAFQIVMPAANPVDLLYVPGANVIVSLSTSKTTWASGSPLGVGGAVAGAETVFVSGSQLLAEPH
jgi:hypothetical protein